MKKIPVVALALVLIGAFQVSGAADLSKPPPPSAAVSDWAKADLSVMCVGCDERFGTAAHKIILRGLANNPYNTQLRRALYLQDTVHQFESRAHFDNCDFESSTTYIAELLDEVETYVKLAQTAKSAGNTVDMGAAVELAFFALGQALHGVQDFYAHTNYVELEVPKVKRMDDIQIVKSWQKEGIAQIQALEKKGLISGVVFWGFPKKCPVGTISHGDLAKDSATTKSGKRDVKHLEDLSQYKIAVFLARRASLSFMEDAFERWPLLADVNGPAVAVEVLLDRRGL